MRYARRTSGALVGAAAAGVLLVAGCSSAGEADADCAWRLAYGGRTYLPLPGEEPMPDSVRHHGSPLGQGQFAACSDSEGDSTGARIAVYPIEGAAPEQAVITEDDEIGVTDPAHVPPAVQALLGTPSPS